MIRIKKYGNRRLYNTETSRYLNLDELAALIKGGETVEVVDATSGEDLTRAVLLQLILEAEQGAALFPPGLLHRMVRGLGVHPGQRWMTQQLGQALSLLDTQLAAAEAQFPWLKSGVWPTAPGGAAPGAQGGAGPSPTSQASEPEPEPAENPAQGAPSGAVEAELDALRARLAGLEARLKR